MTRRLEIRRMWVEEIRLYQELIGGEVDRVRTLEIMWDSIYADKNFQICKNAVKNAKLNREEAERANACIQQELATLEESSLHDDFPLEPIELETLLG